MSEVYFVMSHVRTRASITLALCVAATRCKAGLDSVLRAHHEVPGGGGAGDLAKVTDMCTAEVSSDTGVLSLLQAQARLRHAHEEVKAVPSSISTKEDDALRQWENAAASIRVEDLPPARLNDGGGLTGGYVNDNVFAVPAPASHFPATCQWTSSKRIALVHVGKCAGGTLRGMLESLPVNFTHVHVAWAEHFFDPEQYDLFIIPTRDPVERVVSAFNWRHPIGGGASHGPSPAERDMYACFPEMPGALNRFAEALDESSDCGLLARRCLHSPRARCGHLARGAQWYLQTGASRDSYDVLSALRELPGKHAIAVPTESLSGDLSYLWDFLCIPPALRPGKFLSKHTTYDRQNDTDLSPRGRAALAKHLTHEAFVLEELLTLSDKG